MLRKLIFIAVFLSFTFPVFAGQFKVTRVYDGDTLKAVGHDIEIKVRLVGIDAPETKKRKHKPGQPFGEKAKKFMAAMVLNKTVDIKGYGLGPYTRILAVVYVGRKNLNLELVKAGLAEVYQGKPPRGFDLSPYLTAEAQAKSQRRGMWSQGDKYVSPRDWRKMNKK
jgi:endonuclease YncB( thermonuclease family)